MCWGPDISINTFLLGVLTLCFIYYTNTYTKYHTPVFNNKWAYVFGFLVISMQLVEYFIWKNIKNEKMNYIYSRIAYSLLGLQPIPLIMMIINEKIRYITLVAYVSYIFIYNIIKINVKTQLTTISQNGHLLWNWLTFSGYEYIFLMIYMSFYLFSAYYIKNHQLLWFIIISFSLSFITYFRDKTWGSMWCWVSNIIWIYFIIKITVIQPFIEYNGLC
jgi:hypothetical protein